MTLIITLLVLAASFAPPAWAASAILECIADTSVVAASSNLTPQGRSRQLLLDQARSIVLVDFRFAAVERWRITKATLLLHAGSALAGQIGVSTISADWRETEATFQSPRTGLAWNSLGGDLRDVIFSRSDSRYTFTRAEPYQDAWIQIRVDPAMIDWLLAGKGYGLALLSLSRDPIRLGARETVGTAPYLLVEGVPK